MGSQMIAEIEAKPGHIHQHVIFQPQIVERASVVKKGGFDHSLVD
jgi:hypothetical protein